MCRSGMRVSGVAAVTGMVADKDKGNADSSTECAQALYCMHKVKSAVEKLWDGRDDINTASLLFGLASILGTDRYLLRLID